MGAPNLPVTVAGTIGMDAARVPGAMLDALRRRLTVEQPERPLCIVAEYGGRIILPRGSMGVLREVAHDHGMRLATTDARTWPPERLDIAERPQLRDYQATAIAALQRWHQGIIRYPAGAGKTRTAIGAIAVLRTPTLVVVGTLDLAQQWRTEIGRLLDIEPGLIAEGRGDVRAITVASAQSLALMDHGERGQLLARWGMLIVDECHHSASPSWGEIIDACPARYRLGLSATPNREDGLGPLVTWRMGDVIAGISHDELIRAGHLQRATVRELRSGYRYDYAGPDDWAPLLDDLVADEARNGLIVDSIERDADAGHSILALTGRVAHAEHLAAMLCERGVKAVALVGRVPRRRRTEILDAARAGTSRVIVATQLADEGLDIPRLSRVYQCFPARSAPRTEQRLGRVMRPHADALDCAIIDVVDHHVGVLKHQARKRMAVYRRVLGTVERRGAA